MLGSQTTQGRKFLTSNAAATATALKALPDLSFDQKRVPTNLRRRVPFLKPASPHEKNRLLVVLDMDETLIHSEFFSGRRIPSHVSARGKPDLILNFGDETCAVFKRPGVDRFLSVIREKYTACIYTAATKEYADQVLDWLDPQRTCIGRRFYRDSTYNFFGNDFSKDVTLFGRDLKRVVLVDNSVPAGLPNLDNLIPIPSFFGNGGEDEVDDDAVRSTWTAVFSSTPSSTPTNSPAALSSAQRAQRYEADFDDILKLLQRLEGVDDVRDVLRNEFARHAEVADLRAQIVKICTAAFRMNAKL